MFHPNIAGLELSLMYDSRGRLVSNNAKVEMTSHITRLELAFGRIC